MIYLYIILIHRDAKLISFTRVYLFTGERECIPACTWTGEVLSGSVDRGVCGQIGVWTGDVVKGVYPPVMATDAVSTHPTGMHY